MQRLLKLCKDLDIKVEAYGPLNSVFRSTGGPLDPVVDKIAKAKGATPGQVLLRWTTQYTGGIAVT
jgi:diketogulonate reductase-like aldo/keto reductase